MVIETCEEVGGGVVSKVPNTARLHGIEWKELSFSARTVDILKYHADGILGLAEGQTQLPRTLQNAGV